MKGLKPITNEPWADDCLANDALWDRLTSNPSAEYEDQFRGSKMDVQAKLRSGNVEYNLGTTERRKMREVLRFEC